VWCASRTVDSYSG
jgi:hypothetical protein